MNFLTNLKIGKRLAIAFAVMLGISILISGISIWRLQTVANSTRAMMEQPLAKERLVTDLARLVFVGVVRTTAIAQSSDNSLATFFAKDAAASSGAGGKLITQIEALLDSPEEKATMKAMLESRTRYAAARDTLMKAKAAGDVATANRLMEQEYAPSSVGYQGGLAKLIEMQRANIDNLARQVDELAKASRWLISLLSVLSLAFGIVCAWLLTTSITRPLGQAVAVARHIADGDLRAQIVVKSRDETGQLLQALKDMNDSLVRIVSQVRTGTETIASASTQIASGTLDLSSRTEQQASSLEETASSMEELTSTVKQNSENASQANQLAISASEVATKGGAVVSQVVQTMDSINDSSRKIVDIISVIDGIAFQTNILALNAAVEAARAGEQGRGFAVVASEVRSLAQRSAAAAKEIKTLIDDSVEKVDVGSKLVNQAGSTMDEVVQSIQRVTDIMGEITAAAREQSAGIEQVNQAITEMDNVTQQNAALVEEASAAAQSMQDQAGNLSSTVSVFKLDGMQQSMAIPRAAQAAKPAAIEPPRKSAAAKALPMAQQPKKLASAGGEDWEEF